MLSPEKRTTLAYLIALGGLVLTVISLVMRQPLGAILGGIITIAFVVCVAVLERNAKKK
jgi:hypothetical protein